jgi:hypothetical protein
MVELENNNGQSSLPPRVALEVDGEDGDVFLIFRDPDSHDTVAEFYTSDPMDVNDIIEDLKNALKEAF